MAAEKYDRPVASHLVAEAEGIPERFLLKVLKPLVSAGVLLSIKGPNGGYRLARPASDISLLELVEAIEGPVWGNHSLTNHVGKNAVNARIENVFKQTAEQVRRQLEKVRLSDLIRR